MDEIERI
jgi:hypothetical protein